MTRRQRPYGVRAQDWMAMRQFEYEKQVNPYVSDRRTVWVRSPCRCAKWLFAHYHDNLPMESTVKK